MPVIGRLEGQVDEVIIKPIRGRREDDPRPPEAGARAPEPSAPPRPDPVQTPPVNESSADTDELPVWLL